MTKFIATNSGPRAQIIRIAGGTITLKPGHTIEEVEPKPALDDALKDHYRQRGVTFSVADRGKAEKKAAAEKANAAKLAEEAVAAAKAKFEAAGDNMVAKAAAEDELKAAEAALAGLKG